MEIMQPQTLMTAEADELMTQIRADLKEQMLGRILVDTINDGLKDAGMELDPDDRENDPIRQFVYWCCMTVDFTKDELPDMQNAWLSLGEVRNIVRQAQLAETDELHPDVVSSMFGMMIESIRRRWTDYKEDHSLPAVVN